MEKFVAWCIDTLKWVAVCALCVAILIAMLFFSMPAKAEENIETIVVEDYIVTVDNGCLIVIINYNGELVSLYWDNILDTSRPLVITMYNFEVIDAFYLPSFP